MISDLSLKKVLLEALISKLGAVGTELSEASSAVCEHTYRLSTARERQETLTVQYGNLLELLLWAGADPDELAIARKWYLSDMRGLKMSIDDPGWRARYTDEKKKAEELAKQPVEPED